MLICFISNNKNTILLATKKENRKLSIKKENIYISQYRPVKKLNIILF